MKIICIAGGSASGKSTLAARLQTELSAYRVRLFAMDAYYKTEKELPLVTLPNGKTYRDYNCPESFDLAKLRQDLGQCIREDACDIVLVEGLFALWDDALCKSADLRIFLDCPADIRVVRRLRRNLSWGLSFEEIAEVYLDLVRYRHEEYVAPSVARADLVLDTTHGAEEHIGTVISHIV